jgi:hypothetical protein
MKQFGACTHVLTPSETALTALDANMAINMCPLPVGATVTAHDVPVDPEQRFPLVTCCTWVILACAAKQNSRLRIIVFTPVRLPRVSATPRHDAELLVVRKEVLKSLMNS